VDANNTLFLAPRKHLLDCFRRGVRAHSSDWACVRIRNRKPH
jgi:hypothetical protein